MTEMLKPRLTRIGQEVQHDVQTKIDKLVKHVTLNLFQGLFFNLSLATLRSEGEKSPYNKRISPFSRNDSLHMKLELKWLNRILLIM
jgi:hypothetical protein